MAAVSGDPAAAERRISEIDEAYRGILDNPGSGVRLDGVLAGYCVRHAGRDNKLSIVFRHDEAAQAVFIVHVAFGGQDWLGTAADRSQ